MERRRRYAPAMKPLVLFDIDGTLLRTGGAGRQAMDDAFLAVHGWTRATEGVPIGGSTDGAICAGVARKHAAEVDVPAVRERYLERLVERLGDGARVEVCPGVFELIAALEGRAHIALLTGNWSAGAALKLGAAGLGGVFPWGAYAEDAVDRNALLPIARERARGLGVQYGAAVIIGDTPADVACARAGHGKVIAVETGFGSAEELAKSAPDLQVPDLARGLGWVLAFLLPTDLSPTGPDQPLR